MGRVGIIGGGASGILAAIAAAECGADVAVFEANERIGKKILATGNGRCNMTNVNADVNNYHGTDPKFIEGAASEFWVDETISFFENIGLITKTENEGKVYPYCGLASAVVDVLRLKADSLGITIYTSFEVKDVIKKKNGFMVVSYDNQREKVEKLIISTGGKAMPSSGSKGMGYELLKKLGHTITDLCPAIVQIKTNPEEVRKLKGIKVNACVRVDGKHSCGEVLFTEYGLSGPPVFFLSSYIEHQKTIYLDLMPEYSREQIIQILVDKQKNCGKYMQLDNFMSGIINKKLGQIVLKHCTKYSLAKNASELTYTEIENIASFVKEWSLEIEGTMSWNNAQVTRGGAVTEEFNKKTLESRIVSGLYASGEVLDIDGDCGGYNLQWAWSSGYIAGKNAADSLKI